MCRDVRINVFVWFVKHVWHKTRLGTRFQYGILGYRRVDWYEYWAPTVPGDELVRFRLECSTNKARIYSIKQGLSRFEHDLQNDFHTIVVRSSTVCYGLVRLNTTFTRLTGHLQGLHTVPPTFVRVRFHTIYIRYWHGWAHSWSGLHVRLYIRSRTVAHGLSRSCTVSHFLSRYWTIANTIIHGHGTRVRFSKVLKNHTRLSRIHSNGPSVTVGSVVTVYGLHGEVVCSVWDRRKGNHSCCRTLMEQRRRRRWLNVPAVKIHRNFQCWTKIYRFNPTTASH